MLLRLTEWETLRIQESFQRNLPTDRSSQVGTGIKLITAHATCGFNSERDFRRCLGFALLAFHVEHYSKGELNAWQRSVVANEL